jgi:hypothetical protein
MRRILVVLFLTALAIAGCSGGGTPVTPVSDERPAFPTDSLPIIEGTSYSDGSFQASGILGAYELRIDPATMSADLVAKRTPSLGESWTVSGKAFFTIAPCSNCLTIDSVELTVENYLKVHFAINHPFDPGVTTLPPSGKNRLDLDIFDVAAVIVPMGGTATNYALMGKAAYTGVLANNAGYTTELANITTDPAAMPYALVVDDNAAATDTWNKFPMGTDSFFDVFFDLNTITTLGFDMYLTFGYGKSAEKKANRLTPTYFNPEFNRKQAWKVVVTPPQGSNPPAMGNTWADNNPTEIYNVKVEVFDWQQGVTTVANPPVLPTDIAFLSNVSSVSVDIPGMNTTLPTATTPTGGTGEPDNPLVFEVPIANQNTLAAGEYIGLVKVSDERVPEATPALIDFMIHTPNGIELVNYAIPAFETYQTFVATVVVGCGPITGSITTPTCPVTGQSNGAKINFTVTASSANGGNPITLYECDYDYNGTTFTTDFSNATGVFANVGPFSVPDPCADNVPQDFTVAFRATDSCTPANVTLFATCVVTVTLCAHITCIDDEPIAAGDTWYDICVKPNSWVYAITDHVSTGHTGGTCTGNRTILRYNNDLSGVTVITNTDGTGMGRLSYCSGFPWNMSAQWEDMDVSINGTLVANMAGLFVTYGQYGTTVTRLSTHWYYGGMPYPEDLTCGQDAPYGEVLAGLAYDSSYVFDWGMLFTDSNPSTYGAYWIKAAPNYYPNAIAVDMPATGGNVEMVALTSSATTARLSRLGNIVGAGVTITEIATTGTYGSGDGQFKGTTDVAMDGNNKLLTLENQGGGVYRIQCFTYPALAWQWTHVWNCTGNPLRMDFDRGDNMLYVLCNDRIWIVQVN